MSFGLLKRLGSVWTNEDASDLCYRNLKPSVTLQTDKGIYRPGESVVATLKIENPVTPITGLSFFVENLKFEINGIEKLDHQWFPSQMPTPGIRQRKGDNIFLDCTTPSFAPKVAISSGCTKTYMVQSELPNVLPPSYRGTTVRYTYCLRSILHGHWFPLKSDPVDDDVRRNLMKMEVHAPFQVWVTWQTTNPAEENEKSDLLPSATIQIHMSWKEEDDSDWIKGCEVDVFEEGYDSSRDDISSVSSYNHYRSNLDKVFRSSLSLQSHIPKQSFRNDVIAHGERFNMSSYATPLQASVSEIVHGSPEDMVQLENPLRLPSTPSLGEHHSYPDSHVANDRVESSSVRGATISAASEGFTQGRSYNIKIDDQVLLRFSPKNSDLTHYFGDMLGGTLNFFNEGARRCLEVSVTLETLETIKHRHVHQLQKGATITKVYRDYYEVVADVLQTSFLFSLPMNGPMSFSTHHVSVCWILRFEFFITPKNVDWRSYAHPLLIEKREKSEWILPIVVHAPPAALQAPANENPLSLEELWMPSF